MNKAPLATVQKTNIGPKLLVSGVVVRVWLGPEYEDDAGNLANLINAAAVAPENNAQKYLTGIRQMCGYVENSSDTKLQIYQDDSSREWTVKVGNSGYHDDSFSGALDAAMAANPPED